MNGAHLILTFFSISFFKNLSGVTVAPKNVCTDKHWHIDEIFLLRISEAPESLILFSTYSVSFPNHPLIDLIATPKSTWLFWPVNECHRHQQSWNQVPVCSHIRVSRFHWFYNNGLSRNLEIYICLTTPLWNQPTSTICLFLAQSFPLFL